MLTDNTKKEKTTLFYYTTPWLKKREIIREQDIAICHPGNVKKLTNLFGGEYELIQVFSLYHLLGIKEPTVAPYKQPDRPTVKKTRMSFIGS